MTNEDGTDNILSKQFTFSARTCLEFIDILTPEQIEIEYKHLLAMNANFKSDYKKPTVEHKRSVLYKHLSKTLCQETDVIVNNLHSLISGIGSPSQKTEDVSSSVDASSDRQLPAEIVPTALLLPAVRFLDVNVSDIPYEDVNSAITFTDEHRGGRETAYFGSVPYSYSSVKHEPVDYPAESDVKLFSILAERIKTVDPDFLMEDYTCLVTRYKDGKVTIPLHSDNEKIIEPGSNIYTVSFGAVRTVRFRNFVGPITEEEHKLEHGSIHVMTQQSQTQWKHGLQYEPEVTGARISFTFRKLSNGAPESAVSDTQSLPVPPIAPPTTGSALGDRL